MKGKVVTVDSRDSIIEAVAVKDGLILETGSSEEIMKLWDQGPGWSTLRRRRSSRGFIDSHTHPPSAGTRLFAIDCRSPPAKSIKEILLPLKHLSHRL